MQANQAITDIQLDRVFIGSCTNSRIEDLRAAAVIAKGRKVASTIKQAIVVPGSGLVKAQAEAEGLDKIFLEAGFEWREPGCSMCQARRHGAGRLGHFTDHVLQVDDKAVHRMANRAQFVLGTNGDAPVC